MGVVLHTLRMTRNRLRLNIYAIVRVRARVSEHMPVPNGHSYPRHTALIKNGTPISEWSNLLYLYDVPDYDDRND